jgi:AcrR family transcriptional regulator
MPTRQAPPRRDQRSRLLDATVDVVALDGYVHARVGDIARRARISRAGFYEHFPNKEECFLEACRLAADRVLSELTTAAQEAEPARAAHAVAAGLARCAAEDPGAFACLSHRTMLLGPAGWQERDRLLAALERVIERAWVGASDDDLLPDLPPRLLLDASMRLLGLTVRRQRSVPPETVDGMLRWIDLYRVRAAGSRWRRFVADPALVRTRPLDTGPTQLPRPLPKSRSRAASAALRGTQQERITYATADVLRTRGVTGATVTDIASRAGLSRDVFYSHFADKERALEQTVNFAFERVMSSVAGAFFYTPGGWCEQVWAAWEAFLRFLETNPTLAHVVLVATHAPLGLLRRVDDFTRAFTIFLEGGYHNGPRAEQVPRIASEALVSLVLESSSLHIREGRTEELRGSTPVVVYAILAPFMGTDAATEFVETKVAAARSRAEAPGRREPRLL